MYNMNKIKICL